MQQLCWQSLLFVPVGAERHLASAIRHRPDAVILDLEDAIRLADKDAARARLATDQSLIAAAGLDCVLRVNAPLVQMVQDLAAADLKHLSAVMVPKVENTRPVLNAADLADLPVIALIESPAALEALPSIAACPPVAGLMLGSEDFSAALGIDPSGGGLDLPFGMIAAAAAVRGLLAIGFPASISEFRNLDKYGAGVARGRAMGANAVAAIHPAQLPVIAEVIVPTAQERDWAKRVVAGLHGGGVAVVDGAMVDAPVLARARRILMRPERG